MEFFDDDTMRGLLANSLETAALGPDGFYDVGTGPGSHEAHHISWLTIADQKASVTEDVRRIRNHPLVALAIPNYGYYFDLKTGRLVEVAEATVIGRASSKES
jgi:carbonic anhydrase